MEKKMEATNDTNVEPSLMEGFGIIKRFGEIIQNQLLFGGSE